MAGHLVRYARVSGEHAVLDVGTGTGVVVITARNPGAQVTGLDLTPALPAAFRNEMDEVPGEYLHDNVVRHEYLLTRAVKV